MASASSTDVPPPPAPHPQTRGVKRCPHGKQKYYCRECRGAGICSHGKQKYTCKECKGSSICKHNKQKATCRDCGGSSICEHDKVKYYCKECCGAGICKHDRQKATCRDCGGNNLCSHGIQKYTCRECNGTGVCKHDRQKAYCKECRGAGICKHNKRKATCRDCDGNNICSHGKQKESCKECNDFRCNIETCPRFNHRFAGAQSLLMHMRTQHSEEPKALAKRKELVLYQDLQKAGVEFEFQKHVPFRSCGLESETRCAYVDFVITMPWGYILLECDEDQHRSYDPSCDVRRDFDIAASVALGSSHKLMIVRYNPDSYRVGGSVRTESKKDRLRRLLAIMDYEPTSFERVFLFYDQDEGASLPQVAASWDVAAKQVSRIK